MFLLSGWVSIRVAQLALTRDLGRRYSTLQLALSGLRPDKGC
jgi:hypothetical protein